MFREKKNALPQKALKTQSLIWPKTSQFDMKSWKNSNSNLLEIAIIVSIVETTGALGGKNHQEVYSMKVACLGL